jgi:competence protein ComEA
MPDAALTRPALRPRPRDARAAAVARLRRLLGTGAPPAAGAPSLDSAGPPPEAAEAPPADDVAAEAASPSLPSPGGGGAWRARWHVEPGAAVGVVLVAVVALVAGGLYVWQSRPAPVPPPEPAAVASSPAETPATSVSPGGTPTPSPTAVVVVDVTGKVREPGVVTLPEGSRVVDALEAAGGARPKADTTGLNLARVLADGEQVRVDVPGAPPAPTGGGPSSSPAPVDLNTADLATLEELPGVGPVLAQRILDHRESTGGFTAVDELQEVSGIGDQTLADLRDRVRV